MGVTLPWPPPLWNPPDPDVPGRMRRLLEKLGHPHLHLPPVVHICGTTGKSSVLTYMRAMAEAAGLAVHALQGPHRYRFNERILLTGKEVNEATLHTVLERCREAAGGEAYTLQEGITAAALLLFAEHPADIVLLESHAGGLVDATNVLEQVRLSILTSISYGHTPLLGDALEDIAAHHLGILRNNVPCVSSIQVPTVMKELEKLTKTLDIALFSYGNAWKIHRVDRGVVYTDVVRDTSWELPFPAMKGDHQLLNAGVAITAANQLAEDFSLSPEHIAEGYCRAWLPGRMEHIRKGRLVRLLPQDWELWFDGTAMPAALYAMRQMAEKDWRDRPLYLIYGASKRYQRLPDITAGLQAFRHKVAMVQAVSVPDDPHSASAKEILNCAQEAGLQGQKALNVEYALSNLRKIAGKEPIRVLLAGSMQFAPGLR